jgi:hypothetical protein
MVNSLLCKTNKAEGGCGRQFTASRLLQTMWWLCCQLISNMLVRAWLQAACWLVDVHWRWMAAKRLEEVSLKT